MAQQEVATQAQPGTEVMESRTIDRFKRQLENISVTITNMLPAHVPPEKFKSSLVTAVAYNQKLLACSPQSLIREAVTAAELGLSLNPNMKEADLLPVWSKNGTEAQFRPRYGGLMKLARQGGEIVDIYAHEVYENDLFDYDYGLDRRLIHKPASGDRGKIIAAYCVWTTRDGIKSFEVIDQRRIARAKDASEGYKAFKAGKIKSTPWATDEGEMTRKTAVRAAAKYMPQSTENEAFRRAVAIDQDVDEPAEPVRLQAVDTPAEPPPPPKPTRESVRAEAETARKESVRMNNEYRQTMDDGGPDPADDESGDADGGQPPAEEPAAAPKAAPEPPPAQEPVDVPKAIAMLKKKVVGAATLQVLNALEVDYNDELLDIEAANPTAAQEIAGMIEGKRKALRGR